MYGLYFAMGRTVGRVYRKVKADDQDGWTGGERCNQFWKGLYGR
jgi:hypothetical protein